MPYRYQRSPQGPRRVRSARGLGLLFVLGAGIAFTFLRSSLNLAILEASEELHEVTGRHEALVRDVTDLRHQLEQCTHPVQIAPRAAKLGLPEVQPSQVTLVALSTPGASATAGSGLDMLMQRLASIAVDAAHAAPAPVGTEDWADPAGGDADADRHAATPELTTHAHCEACAALIAHRAARHGKGR